MGNISSMARASTALDSYVAELGNDISYDKSLSSSRFLKTILARHAYGLIVLKIFIKPDVTMSLRAIQRRLKTERDALADLINANTYQTFVETEKAGYLIRQWAGSNLYDRIRWIAFQLLTCLRDARARKVAHGDIKSENVLIQSDLTILLTDFSSAFKPTFLPLDDPSDFSFFFDTSSRRTCYVAPERFFAADAKVAQDKKTTGENEKQGSSKRDGKVTEEMDVFSAGCVLAEMWTDGRSVFNLSELYAYREGSIGLDIILNNIDDLPVKDMIATMLSRTPSDRPKFDRILSSFRGTIFPEYFYTFLQDYTSSLNELAASAGPAYFQNASSKPGNKIDRMANEWESISIHLEGTAPENHPAEVGPALLLLNIVTSSIRNCLWPTSRIHGLKLFVDLLPYLSDEDRVDRIIPFTVELLADEVAIVRAEACRTIMLTVETIESISPLNATFIPEYLLPLMRDLATDPDIFVRATYAKSLVRLADAAVKMLELSQAATIERKDQDTSGIPELDYDAMLQEIQAVVEEQATVLLVDISPNVKRSMLSSIADLCLFFGRQKSSETVLSHIMTYLNDRDWMLRLAFFDGIVGVGAFIGIKAIEEYVLPLMLQALADQEESVIARVISSLTSLASLGLLPRMRIWDAFSPVRGFLCHPNDWIRQSATGFIAAAARNLPPSDTWCILYPSLRALLHSDILEMDEPSILSAVITPLSRSTLLAAKSAALSNSPPGFWDIVTDGGPTTKTSLVKSAFSSKAIAGHYLKDKGISAKDEKKILAMKDFIKRQAHGSRGRATTEQDLQPEAELVSGKPVSLTDLGVTPQTVFISPRTVGVDAKTAFKRLRPGLSEDSGSRRTSFASRSNRGATGDNPLDEIRKRLASLEPMTPKSDKISPETALQLDASPSDSVFSSTVDLPSARRGGKKKLDSKAAPAIGASYTVALGTASIRDNASTGRASPVPEGQITPKAAPYSSSYEGHDPGVRAFLEQVDLENYREPWLDFGPRITANQKKRPPRPKSNSPQNVTMIAHLTQHTAPINAIVTSPDHTFFATASVDSQILIWDTARLERSVSAKARLIYRMDAPVSSICRIENTYCLAAASEDGQLHILRVHVTTGSSTRYSKVECIRTWAAERKDGHIVTVSHLRDSTLLLITSNSTIALLDIRTMDITTRFQHPLELGVITVTCPSTYWVVLGTESGSLSLWDLRFGLLLKSWRASGSITAIQLHPSKGKGRWIMVSTKRKEEGPIVEVYDIETSKLMEIYEIRTTRPTSKSTISPDAEPPMSKEEYIKDILSKQAVLENEDDGSSANITTPSVMALIVGTGFTSLANREEESSSLLLPVSETKSANSNPGWMITAGEDRVVRCWDLAKVSDGFVICGSQKEKEVQFKQLSGSTPTLNYTLPAQQRQSVDNRHAGMASARQPLRPHYDVVCALGTVDTPFSSCVISADRSGVIKVWRLESGT